MKKINRHKINPFIFFIISACLLYAMYLSLSTLALGVFGDIVTGTVYSYDSRFDTTRGDLNNSRTVTKYYYFSANGSEYKGYAMYRSDEMWPRLEDGETRSELISYLPFFPQINKPSMLCDFDLMGTGAIIYHILSPVGYVLLFLLISGNLFKKKAEDETQAEHESVVEIETNESRRINRMFCKRCGGNLNEDSAFCPSCGERVVKNEPAHCSDCGAALTEGAAFCISCGKPVDSGKAQAAAPPPVYEVRRESVAQTGLIGFSARSTSPEIAAAAKESRKTSVGCMWVLVLVPLLGFPLAGLLIEEFPLGEGLVIGVGIALVMLIINLLALSGSKKPAWDGVVVRKYSRERYDRHRSEGETDTYTSYTEFNTVIKKDSGGKKTIVEKGSGRIMYDYLSEGDRVRYHPAFQTYEKYDKSGDRIIYCNVCSMMNPIENDRCKRCNNLLFK